MEKEELVGLSRHEYAPMIRPQTEQLLRSLIKKHKPKTCLEIGTFLGYSASCILSECDCTLTTVEKDEQNFADAKENLKEFSSRVEIIHADAMDFLLNNTKKFDFIFLDGAKGQYFKYLPYLKESLNAGGVLMADDVLFYGLVGSEEKVLHKHRSIATHLRLFLQKLQDDADFKTTIYDFEDGVSVSEKIQKEV